MRVLLFLLPATLAFGQLDSNSITITASRSISIQPDQVVLSVSVIAPVSTAFDQVVGALQSSGVAGAQFSGVGAIPNLGLGTLSVPQPVVQWVFTITAPIAKLKDTTLLLTSAQQSILKQGGGMQLSFSVSGAQASPQLIAAQQCSQSDLIADARIQAQKLATAAGVTLGNVLALSSLSSSGAIAAGNFINVPTFAYRSGDFSSVGGYASLVIGAITPVLTPIQPLSCSLTVKFAMTRY